jgi:putative sporulation protein YtaF
VQATLQRGSKPGAFKRLLLLLDDPSSADRDSSRHIDAKESWILAIALSLNNMVNGVAAGMVKMSPILTTVLVAFFSMVTLKAGLLAGYHCGRRWLGSFTGLVSGLLLVFIGVCEFRI